MGRGDRAGGHQVRVTVVMPGHSRSKNGVAWLAYVPGIHVFRGLEEDVDGRVKPGHDAQTRHFPRRRTRPILCRWRKARTSAIPPSIRKKTRPSRPAPRRRGRICRCSTIRWRICSIPGSARVRPGLARRPGCSSRPTIPGTAAPTSPMRIGRAPRWRAVLVSRRSRAMSAKVRWRRANSIPIWRKPWGSTKRPMPPSAAASSNMARKIAASACGRCPKAVSARSAARRASNRSTGCCARPRRIPRPAIMDAAPAAATGQVRRRPQARHQIRL